jgi:hypothetical protein
MTALLCTLVFVLAFATSAAAECAWVLWSEYLQLFPGQANPVTAGWQIESTVGTYTMCEASSKEHAERHSQPDPNDTNIRWVKMDRGLGAGFSVHKLLTQPTNASSVMVFQCFPSTVDPRGPRETTASEECAWVMWIVNPRLRPNPERQAAPLASYSTMELCKLAQKLAGGTKESYSLCLPDTVDPRGPKGGH